MVGGIVDHVDIPVQQGRETGRVLSNGPEHHLIPMRLTPPIVRELLHRDLAAR